MPEKRMRGGHPCHIAHVRSKRIYVDLKNCRYIWGSTNVKMGGEVLLLLQSAHHPTHVYVADLNEIILIIDLVLPESTCSHMISSIKSIRHPPRGQIHETSITETRPHAWVVVVLPVLSYLICALSKQIRTWTSERETWTTIDFGDQHS